MFWAQRTAFVRAPKQKRASLVKKVLGSQRDWNTEEKGRLTLGRRRGEA